MRIQFVGHITGADVLQKKFFRWSRKGPEAFSQSLVDQAFEMRDRIAELAPKETGAYARSIEVLQYTRSNIIFSRLVIQITTWHPAAMRLEYGFVGRDSLGRVYNQPPQPHWRPVLAQYRPLIGKTALRKTLVVFG